MTNYPPPGSTITQWHDRPLIARHTDTVTVREGAPRKMHVPIEIQSADGDVVQWTLVHVERIAEWEE